MTRQELLDQFIARYPVSDPGSLPDASGQYLLIQQSSIDGSYWLSTHDTPQQAGEYVDAEEYCGDWAIKALFDLDTGARYSAQTTTTFKRDEVTA